MSPQIASLNNYTYRIIYYIDDPTNTSKKTVDDWLANLHADTAPFVPQPHNETDTMYFDARNNMQEWKISQFIDNVG